MSCMSAEAGPLAFVDTNILVYAFAGDDPIRSSLARSLIKDLMGRGLFRTSTQILQELYVTLTRKAKLPFSPDQALRYLDRIAAWPVLSIDYAMIREAVELGVRARLSFWDAIVVVAAARSGAGLLYTEDLNHGQHILGVEIVNPFHGVPTPRRSR